MSRCEHRPLNNHLLDSMSGINAVLDHVSWSADESWAEENGVVVMLVVVVVVVVVVER